MEMTGEMTGQVIVDRCVICGRDIPLERTVRVTCGSFLCTHLLNLKKRTAEKKLVQDLEEEHRRTAPPPEPLGLDHPDHFCHCEHALPEMDIEDVEADWTSILRNTTILR